MDALSYPPYTDYDRLSCQCLCAVLKFRRARNNMVQQSDRREDERKKINRLEMCLSIYTERMSMESIRYFPSPYAIQRHLHSHSLTQTHLYGCAFLPLRSRCITHVVTFACIVVWRESKKNCISFNAIVFSIIISRNLAHDSLHTIRTFGLDCVFFLFFFSVAASLYVALTLLFTDHRSCTVFYVMRL